MMFRDDIPLCCPACRGTLDFDARACSSCGTAFGDHGGIAVFLEDAAMAAAAQAERSDRENALKNFFKRWPRFYRFVTRLVIPLVYTGLTSEQFLARFPKESRLLVVGSGPYRIHPSAVDVDLFPFPNVDVVADAAHLPFPDGTFDAVCTEQVLEHVADPQSVAQELLRVVKPEGLIYTGTPFMMPYHPSPKDYTRWTTEGLAQLFAGNDVVESGVLIGPTSSLLFVFASWCSTVFSFGVFPLRIALNYVFMVALFPFKVLDFLVARLPGAEVASLSVYSVVRKRL